MSKFKITKQKLITLSICLIIPILAFLSNDEMINQEKSGLLLFWPFTAGLLYILWNVLARISNIRTQIKYWWLFCTYLIFIGLMAIIAYCLGFEFNIRQVARGSFALFLILLIQYAMRAQENLAVLQLEKEQYKSEEYKSQLKLLQAKIDPHFLFNCLNTLRSMVSYGHKNSVSFIINLSNFYRQNMKYVEEVSISVAQELRVLNSYLFLMKSRYEDAVILDLGVDNSALEKSLPTMSLQIIVENCFKHNRMSVNSPIKIEIRNTEDNYISVKNNLQMKVERSESEGYGLQSLEKRYNLLNIRNGVIINKDEDFFEVKIKML